MPSRSPEPTAVWSGDRIVGYIRGCPRDGWRAADAGGDHLGYFITPGDARRAIYNRLVADNEADDD